MVGQRFGRLSVIGRVPSPPAGNHRGHAYWLCRCECGRDVSVRADRLRSGETSSCGCLRIGQKTINGGRNSPEYEPWRSAKRRCFNPKNEHFDRYGGRGITMCPEWRDSFEAFLRDVGPRPSPRHSIDRINNDGNYEPGNVRWATKREQMLNTSRSRSNRAAAERIAS